MPTESTTLTVRKMDENGEPLNENEVQTEANIGEILFEELDKAGHSLPHGCLSGSCGACRIEVLEGADLLKDPSTIERDTVSSIKSSLAEKLGEGFLQGRTFRLSCRARIEKAGDIVIAPLK